ncbi:MAG: NAD(P)/FAD-dependent oxidoreductase [Elusimicrobia bacterium]|nr:NAD(P)/FAD-dependent oxidoreductase [Elusimicrobiota bacterium]
MTRVDVAVVGAGAVGLAVARRLAGPGREVVVLERHERQGLETSSRSSEVIHAGLYYPRSSLKARLCLSGRLQLYELCSRHDLFCRKTGKLVAACDPSEVSELKSLLRRGLENGVEGLRILEPGEITRLAPGVSAAAALWSPESGIFDSEELMRFYLGQARDRGALFLWKAELLRVERESGGYRLQVSGEAEPILARTVVNAAGLGADKVAALAGIDPDAAGYRLRYLKGEYFNLRRKLPLETLVYPIPEAHGLGIHLTLDRLGRQRLGPNAFPTPGLDYSVEPSHKESFWRAARRYLPELRLEDLVPGTAGIRPKLSDDGSFRDFVLAEESSRGLPGWVNLIGIDSPGLTASPAIADEVANLLMYDAE